MNPSEVGDYLNQAKKIAIRVVAAANGVAHITLVGLDAESKPMYEIPAELPAGYTWEIPLALQFDPSAPEKAENVQ